MAEVGITRGYRSQHRRWELLMVDWRENNTLQLCPEIRCRDGDGEDWLAVLSLAGERAWEGRQAVFDREKLASPGVIWRAVES